VFKGHVLISPVHHVDNLLDLPPELMVPLFTMAQKVAGVVVDVLGAQGSFVAINNVVSQSIAHLHVHVVPRTKGDGLRGFFWPRTSYTEGEIEEYAKLISEALA
jgi:histidine triad (HIT) family protein